MPGDARPSRRLSLSKTCSSTGPVFGKLRRYQTGEKQRVPGNISLLQLPSYTPLNPVDPSTGSGHLAIPAPESSRRPRL
jgi:hypothetical protein